MTAKFKSFLYGERTFFAAVVLLVGIAAYGLGLQAGQQQNLSATKTPAIIVTQSAEQPVAADAVPVVASKNGTRYHGLDCPGVDTIKEANLIKFASIDLARAAGYLPAGNCEF